MARMPSLSRGTRATHAGNGRGRIGVMCKHDLHAVIRRAGDVSFEYPLGQPFQGPAGNQGYGDEDDCDTEDNPVTEAADETEYGTDPYRRCRRQPADVSVRIMQDHARAEKSDAGQDTLHHAADGVLVR